MSTEREQHAAEWLEAMPPVIRSLYVHDPEVHAWIRHGMRLAATSDDQIETDPAKQERIVQVLVSQGKAFGKTEASAEVIEALSLADDPNYIKKPFADDGGKPAYKDCRKTGPYLPIGKVEWECETHGVDLVRVAGEWGTDARRDQMVCPVAFDIDRHVR